MLMNVGMNLISEWTADNVRQGSPFGSKSRVKIPKRKTDFWARLGFRLLHGAKQLKKGVTERNGGVVIKVALGGVALLEALAQGRVAANVV